MTERGIDGTRERWDEGTTKQLILPWPYSKTWYIYVSMWITPSKGLIFLRVTRDGCWGGVRQRLKIAAQPEYSLAALSTLLLEEQCRSVQIESLLGDVLSDLNHMLYLAKKKQANSSLLSRPHTLQADAKSEEDHDVIRVDLRLEQSQANLKNNSKNSQIKK